MKKILILFLLFIIFIPKAVFGAIAFDAASNYAIHVSGTSLTLAHTCTGSNRILFVTTMGSNGASDVITGITYNGDALTKIGNSQKGTSNRFHALWYLVNPDTGANNIVVSASATDIIKAHGASYTGAHQTVQIDVNEDGVIGSNNVTVFSESITTLIDNSWVIQSLKNSQGGTMTEAGGTTRRAGDDAYGTQISDNNAAKTPAGAVTLGVTNSANTTWAYTMATIVPDTYSTPGGGSEEPKKDDIFWFN